MLEIKNLTIKSLEGKIIINNVSFIVNKFNKLAIIGEEGTGKSTLLKAIYNKELIQNYAIVDGIIETKQLKIGYIAQFIENEWLDSTIEEYLLKISYDSNMNYEDYNKFSLVYNYLDKLNIDLSDEFVLNKKLNILSGGELIKIAILKVLMNEPDILLLDEPSNDLDIHSLDWLEKFINAYENPLVYISHDVTFLSNTANRILHLELKNKRQISDYQYELVGYEAFIKNRKSRIEKQNKIAGFEKREQDAQIEKWNQIYQKTKHRQDQNVRNPSKGRLLKKKMKSLKSQQRRIENTKLTEFATDTEAIFLKFHLENKLPSNKTILNLKNKALYINNFCIQKDLNLLVKGTDKIAIIGQNGVGKTTLIKEIHNTLSQDASITVGYMPQNYQDILKNFEKPIDFLMDGTNEDVSTINTFLGSMNFTYDEIKSNINQLSGGQLAKLLLLKLILLKSNVLILDEPTRNMSPLSIPELIDSLKSFEGCIICISHDRKLLESVFDKIYELGENQLKLVQ